MEKKGPANPFRVLMVRARELICSFNSFWQSRWLAWASLVLMVVVTVGGIFYLASDWSRPRQDSGEDFYWSESSTAGEMTDVPKTEQTALDTVPQPGASVPAPKPSTVEAVTAKAEQQSAALEADPGPLPEEPLAPVMAPGQAFSDLVYPVQAEVTSPFGWRKHPVFADWRYHPGVDMDVAQGTEVKAVMSGTVVELKEDDVWGKLVVIDHGEQRRSTYGHLEQTQVEQGQAVEQGQVIGTVGQTGIAQEPHLHLELRLEGTAVDPTLYLPLPAEDVTDTE